MDKIAYDNAGQDEELIAKAGTLFKRQQQKSRYIVSDIETFALNQQSGKGRQVPHLLVAATTCYNCLNRPFKKQVCDTCGGHHKTPESVFQTRPGKLITPMSKSLIGQKMIHVENADSSN